MTMTLNATATEVLAEQVAAREKAKEAERQRLAERDQLREVLHDGREADADLEKLNARREAMRLRHEKILADLQAEALTLEVERQTLAYRCTRGAEAERELRRTATLQQKRAFAEADTAMQRAAVKTENLRREKETRRAALAGASERDERTRRNADNVRSAERAFNELNAAWEQAEKETAELIAVADRAAAALLED